MRRCYECGTTSGMLLAVTAVHLVKNIPNRKVVVCLDHYDKRDSVATPVVAATPKPVMQTAAKIAVAARAATVPNLTLDNFQDKMNMRFRMTKDQKARGLTRQEAFEERYGSPANADREHVGEGSE